MPPNAPAALDPVRQRWSLAAGDFVPVDEPRGDLVAADSWRLVDGRMRGWDRHWSRFGRAAEAAGLNPALLGRFAAAVGRLLPGQGAWFPRLELWADPTRPGDHELTLLLRTAPPPATTAVVWPTAAGARRAPERKGPDLSYYAELRAAAQAHGADEALLLDEAGRVLEGAGSSLLWWKDETLLALPDEAPILDGVTRRLLLQLATRQGVPIAYHRPTPDELQGREVWLTNALYGIRTVAAWTDGDTPPAPADRAPHWRQALDELNEPLP